MIDLCALSGAEKKTDWKLVRGCVLSFARYGVRGITASPRGVCYLACYGAMIDVLQHRREEASRKDKEQGLSTTRYQISLLNDLCRRMMHSMPCYLRMPKVARGPFTNTSMKVASAFGGGIPTCYFSFITGISTIRTQRNTAAADGRCSVFPKLLAAEKKYGNTTLKSTSVRQSLICVFVPTHRWCMCILLLFQSFSRIKSEIILDPVEFKRRRGAFSMSTILYQTDKTQQS